jgi:hypothetical protein
MQRSACDCAPLDPSTAACDERDHEHALACAEERPCLCEARFKLPEDLEDPRLAAAWVYRTIEPYSRSALGITVCWTTAAVGWDPRPERGLWVRAQAGQARFFGGEFGLWLAALRPLLRR